jgi:hypothetical protein
VIKILSLSGTFQSQIITPKAFFYFSHLAKILWFDIFLYLPIIVHDEPRVVKRRDLIVLYVPQYYSSKLEMSLLLNLHLKYSDLPKIVFSKACLHILNFPFTFSLDFELKLVSAERRHHDTIFCMSSAIKSKTISDKIQLMFPLINILPKIS